MLEDVAWFSVETCLRTLKYNVFLSVWAGLNLFILSPLLLFSHQMKASRVPDSLIGRLYQQMVNSPRDIERYAVEQVAFC